MYISLVRLMINFCYKFYFSENICTISFECFLLSTMLILYCKRLLIALLDHFHDNPQLILQNTFCSVGTKSIELICNLLTLLN